MRTLIGIGVAAFLCVDGVAGAGTTPVVWKPCTLEGVQGKAECTTISVPEDRAKPNGRLIALRAARLLPLSQRVAREPVFVLQGGPGQSAVALAKFYGGEDWAATRATRAIVLIDQRGTGASNALNCSTAGREGDLQSYLGEMFPEDLIAQCVTSVAAHADPTRYTTMDVVEDLEEVRNRLHYDIVDLYGTSYGTRVALAYIERYPQRVRAMILKGVVEPESVVPRSFAEDTERALHLTIEDCASDSQCSVDYPDLAAAYLKLRAALDKGPIVADLVAGERKQRVTLSRGVVASAFRSALQATPFAARLPRVIHAAGQGDYAPLASFVVEVRKAGEGAVSTGMMLSVLCAEDASLLKDENTSGTLMGSYWEERLKGACRTWNVPPRKMPYRSPTVHSTPTLMISGYLDPATPPVHAEVAAKHLPNARQVIVRNGSHSFAGMKGCIDLLIASFLENPTKPRNADCADKVNRPPFARPD
jgi:pimeloyl-ACP methyl ester carboxylesterase